METNETLNCKVGKNQLDVSNLSLIHFIFIKNTFYWIHYSKTYKTCLVILGGGIIIGLFYALPAVFHKLEALLALLYYGHYSIKLIKPV